MTGSPSAHDKRTFETLRALRDPEKVQRENQVTHTHTGSDVRVSADFNSNNRSFPKLWGQFISSLAKLSVKAIGIHVLPKTAEINSGWRKQNSFFTVACWVFSWSMQTVYCSMVGSNSLARDGTWAPPHGELAVLATEPPKSLLVCLFLVINISRKAKMLPNKEKMESQHTSRLSYEQ